MQNTSENADFRVRKIQKKDHRPSRAKQSRAWEQADKESGGMYASYYHHLATGDHDLTAMEMRVAAMIMGMNSTRQIAEKLAIARRTAENHRFHIRRKLQITGENMERQLLKRFVAAPK